MGLLRLMWATLIPGGKRDTSTECLNLGGSYLAFDIIACDCRGLDMKAVSSGTQGDNDDL